jgi:hypothetical protein
MRKRYAIDEKLTELGLNEVLTDSALFVYSSVSSATIGEGFLRLTYDGIYPVRATSSFDFYNTGFEISAELRQAFDPIFFSIYNGLNVATFEILDGNYLCSLLTGGESYNCWGHLNLETSVEDQFFTDYICVSSADVQNKNISLTYFIEDMSNVAVNVVGGTSQKINEDFYVEDNKINWDSGMTLDGEIKAGDILRVIYLARGLSNPARIKFVLKDNTLMTLGMVDGHYTKLMKRTVHSPTTGPWKVSFSMDNSTTEFLKHFQGNSPSINKMGRGYVSKFLAIADSFSNTEKAKPYELKTWRQPVVVYKD